LHYTIIFCILQLYMYKLELLGLKICGKCKELASDFKDNNIKYTFIDVDGDCKLADELEEVLDTVNYPIVTLEYEGTMYCLFVDNNTISQITTSWIPLNIVYELDIKNINFIQKIQCYNLKSMVDKIKSILKN